MQQQQLFSSPVDIDKLFSIADHDKDGVVNVEDAKLFLAGAFISVPSLSAIWSSTVLSHGLSALTREHFPAALAMVSLAQEGLPPPYNTPEALGRPHKAPTFLAVTAAEYAGFEATFAQNADRATGFVSGAKALELFSHRALDRATLGRIWDLADIDKDGRLSKPEFIVMMALVDRASRGLDLPPILPSTLVDSVLNPPPLPSAAPAAQPTLSLSPSTPTAAAITTTTTTTTSSSSSSSSTLPTSNNDFLSGFSSSTSFQQQPQQQPQSSASSLFASSTLPAASTTTTTTTGNILSQQKQQQPFFEDSGLFGETISLSTSSLSSTAQTAQPATASTGAQRQQQQQQQQKRKELEELENTLAAEKAEESRVDAELAQEQQRESDIVRRMKALDAETGREQERTAKVKERLLALQQQSHALAQQKDGLEKTLRENKKREAAATEEIAQVEQQLQRSNAETAALEKESEVIFAQITETRRRQEELAAKLEHNRENLTNAMEAIVAHRKALNEDREKIARAEMARRAALGPESIFPKSRIFGPDFVASTNHRDNPFDTSDMVVTGPNLWCYEPFNPEAK